MGARMRHHIEARRDLSALSRDERTAAKAWASLITCNPLAGRLLSDGSGLRKAYIVPGEDPRSLIGHRRERDALGHSRARTRLVYEVVGEAPGEVIIWAVGLAHPAPGMLSVYDLAHQRRRAWLAARGKDTPSPTPTRASARSSR